MAAEDYSFAGKKRRVDFFDDGETRAEVKFHDVLIDTDVSNSLTKENLVVIPQDATEDGRIGGRIHVVSVALRLMLRLPNKTSNVEPQTLLWRIVEDRQTNGAEFADTDFLETDELTSFANLANRSRFVVHRSGSQSLRLSGGVATGAAYLYAGEQVLLDVFIPLDVVIEYDNSLTTGVVSTQRMSSLWFARIGWPNSGEINEYGYIRVRYTDC